MRTASKGRAVYRGGSGRPPGMAAPLPAASAEDAAARRIAELERKIGQQALDLDFLRRACKRVKESRRSKSAMAGRHLRKNPKHRGIRVNHKRVLRLMRADNLLAVRKRRLVFTTDARHTYVVYPNLAAGLAIHGIDQVWVADITYVRLRETFVYLAMVMDAYSRRVVGWELGEDLRAELAIGALDRALADRGVQPGIVHHSDRGAQYCSEAYVARLQAHGFAISLSRSGIISKIEHSFFTEQPGLNA